MPLCARGSGASLNPLRKVPSSWRCDFSVLLISYSVASLVLTTPFPCASPVPHQKSASGIFVHTITYMQHSCDTSHVAAAILHPISHCKNRYGDWRAADGVGKGLSLKSRAGAFLAGFCGVWWVVAARKMVCSGALWEYPNSRMG